MALLDSERSVDVRFATKAWRAPMPPAAAPSFRLPSEHEGVPILEASEPVGAKGGAPIAAVVIDASGDKGEVGNGDERQAPEVEGPTIGPNHRPQKKAVRFPSQPISAIWVADSVLDYNRRSIVVDLSKTPFALFRRDAVMMKQARTSVDPSKPLPPPGPPQEAVGPLATVSPSADCDASPPSSQSAPSSGERRPSDKLAKLWDSESSESSEGHTDMETDDAETDWHSDAESACSSCKEKEAPPCVVEQQQLRRGSNSESGPAFYGVWKRTSSEGYEELLLSSGVPKRAVAMAMKKHPVHIIDHDGSYFRLIVKNGLSKVDNTFFIGDEPKQDMIGKQSYEVSMDWAHVSGHGSEDELALTSVCHQAGEEVIAIRSLHDGGNKMVLTQIVRRPAEKYEVRAKHFFKRVTSKSELRSSGGGRAEKKKQQHLSSNIVTVRRKK